ncbi:pentatricopeptide repeat-containing protein At2g27800, mitochondrial isoform X4 [Capsella rubella]|uniref:pentatricopeptide repeat-containing protein At2g27800, mitochondrial isoform X4 n=1 Tax=Capsella rubella TaxID=81985 RepID=UPI000CD4AA60|nr:pentatricopeptide repeat-containing protein At2g27800, mitochondrial isoform X4 [Capsella rubella]
MASRSTTSMRSIFRNATSRRLISTRAKPSVPNPNFTSPRFNTSSRTEGSVPRFLRRPFHSLVAAACPVSKLFSDVTSYEVLGRSSSVSMYIQYSTSAPTRSLRRRISNRKKMSMKPVLNESKFQETISKLPPRFTPEELADAITLEEDPFLCFHLFNWASQQPRFKHENCSYHIAIRKLGAAKMYKEMDDIVNQVLSVRHIGNENLYNSIIFYFTKAGKLIRSVNIFRHMVTSKNLECRPTIRTYHILFKALLGRGYVLSLHVNDALRIFHQMSVVYNCQPNSFTYDYLIHGLCAQGRTINGRELFNEMKGKGFVPNGKSYNSLVNALSLSGEIDDAVKCLWEMIENGRLVDFITYKTLVDESCRNGKYDEATRLLEMLQEKKLVDRDSYEKLVNVLHKDM